MKNTMHKMNEKALWPPVIILDYYNELTGLEYIMTKPTAITINTSLKHEFLGNIDAMKEYISSALKSQYVQYVFNNYFKYGVDWLLKPSTIEKVRNSLVYDKYTEKTREESISLFEDMKYIHIPRDGEELVSIMGTLWFTKFLFDCHINGKTIYVNSESIKNKINRELFKYGLDTIGYKVEFAKEDVESIALKEQ